MTPGANRRFGNRDAFHVRSRGLAGVDGLVGVSGIDLDAEAGRSQQLAPAWRSGRQNNVWIRRARVNHVPSPFTHHNGLPVPSCPAPPEV